MEAPSTRNTTHIPCGSAEHHTHSRTAPTRMEDGVGGAARSRACIPISHTRRRVHSLCGCLLPLPYARITGVSYAAARANGFREASLCCALCAQRGPHIGQTLHSSAVGWRVMEVAPARTFTYKFAAAEGVLLCSAFLIIEAEAEHCS